MSPRPAAFATAAPPIAPELRDPAWIGRVFWFLAALVLLGPALVATEFKPWLMFEPASLKSTMRFLAENTSAILIVPGMIFAKSSRGMLSCMPLVNSLPSSVASMSRSITTCTRFGPAIASAASGVEALPCRYRPAV